MDSKIVLQRKWINILKKELINVWVGTSELKYMTESQKIYIKNLLYYIEGTVEKLSKKPKLNKEFNDEILRRIYKKTA